jgi:hypothetical protein
VKRDLFSKISCQTPFINPIFSGCVQGLFQIRLAISIIINDDVGGDDGKPFDGVDNAPPSVHHSDDGTDNNEDNDDI